MIKWEELQGRKVMIQFTAPVALCNASPRGPAPVRPEVPKQYLQILAGNDHPEAQRVFQQLVQMLQQPMLEAVMPCTVEQAPKDDGPLVLSYQLPGNDSRVRLSVARPNDAIAYVSDVSEIVVSKA